MCYVDGMTEFDRSKLGLSKKSEAQVRSELLELASTLAAKASGASSAGDARIYAESAAVVFDAARIRTLGDPTPDGGRIKPLGDPTPDGG
jgi:hypothetical protein